MRPDDDFEYSPQYQAAYRETLEYQQRRLGYAISDTGNEIAKAILPHILSASSMARALFAELHANQVEAMGHIRRWWHLITGHRS